MTDEVRASIGNIIERWGFPVLVALAAGYTLRNDILLPMLDDHRATLRDLRETQKVIAEAVTEQTKLLYALQPRGNHAPVKVEVNDP